MAERAVIYTRVSTDEQSKGFSLTTQREACQALAQRAGYTVLESFTDRESGEILERKGLNELLAFLAQEQVDVVLVYSPDRLSRGGPAHHSLIALRLKYYGARIEYVMGESGDGTPESELSMLIQQTVAWYENHQRNERMTRGRKAKARSGKIIYTGAAPYGYIYRDNELFIHEAEAAVVRQIFAWRVDGLSITQIAEQLTAARILNRGDERTTTHKLRAAGEWNPTTVRKLLIRETYMGLWHYNRFDLTKGPDGKVQRIPRDRSEWITVRVPPIVDAQTFAQAQAVAASNRSQKVRSWDYEFLLRDRIVCACGYKCKCQDSKLGPKYLCPVRTGQLHVKPCQVRIIVKAQTVEEPVWQAVLSILLDEDNLRHAIQLQREQVAAQQRPLLEHAQSIDDALAAVERKLTLLLDHLLEGEYVREVFDERKQLLLHERAALEEERQRIQLKLAAAILTPVAEVSLVEMAQTIRTRAADLAVADKRKILELLNVRVQVVASRQVQVSCLLPFATAAPAPSAPAETKGFALSCLVQLSTKYMRPARKKRDQNGRVIE